jgi:hypothetical protein
MAKSVVRTTTTFKLDTEKKHSVLYKAEGDDVIATSIYISKAMFGGAGSYPQTIKLTIEAGHE